MEVDTGGAVDFVVAVVAEVVLVFVAVGTMKGMEIMMVPPSADDGCCCPSRTTTTTLLSSSSSSFSSPC
jgi:hypothetical protein